MAMLLVETYQDMHGLKSRLSGINQMKKKDNEM